jgi:hypothetical protein
LTKTININPTITPKIPINKQNHNQKSNNNKNKIFSKLLTPLKNSTKNNPAPAAPSQNIQSTGVAYE